MVDAHSAENLLPPMAWDAWGDPTLAKPLSGGIQSLLEQALGLSGTEIPAPSIDEVRVTASALAQRHREGLAAIVGPEHLRTDDRDRLLRAGGKSTPDLLRRKQIHQDAPDAVLLPGNEGEVAAAPTNRLTRELRFTGVAAGRIASAAYWWVERSGFESVGFYRRKRKS